jgi:hypothetical protein
MSEQNGAIYKFLQSLADGHYYGSVGLNYLNGKVTHLRKEENIKASELPGTRNKYDSIGLVSVFETNS